MKFYLKEERKQNNIHGNRMFRSSILYTRRRLTECWWQLNHAVQMYQNYFYVFRKTISVEFVFGKVEKIYISILCFGGMKYASKVYRKAADISLSLLDFTYLLFFSCRIWIWNGGNESNALELFLYSILSLSFYDTENNITYKRLSLCYKYVLK